MPSLEVRNMKMLGEAIRYARMADGVSAADLARDIEITPQYISQIETGKPNLFGSRLFRILRRLGVRVTLTWEPPRSQL